MKQSTPFFATVALAFVMSVGFYGLTGAAPAQACGGGCETPPPPPPPEDCGCDDGGGGGHHGGGHGGGTVINKNHNENYNKNYNKNTNTNTNTNTNINTNTNNVNVTVNTGVNLSASAIANANANSNANLAAGVAARASGAGRGGSGGSGFGIGNGNGSGGGGGSYYVAAPQATPMGSLDVVVRGALAMKPVKGVCVSAKGLEEAARFSTPMREIGATDDVEVFHCVAGDMLVTTIGRMAGAEGQKVPDYTGGYVIECREGEALRHGSNGMLACAPRQGGASAADMAGNGRQGFAEVMIRKADRGEQVVSTNGGAWFSGGVGY